MEQKKACAKGSKQKDCLDITKINSSIPKGVWDKWTSKAKQSKKHFTIGIDLDGVIFNSEEMFRSWAELYDFTSDGKGILNPQELRVSKRFMWEKQKCLDFLDECLLPVLDSAPLMPLSKEMLALLQKAGHKLIAITSRHRPGEIEITSKRMKEEGFDFPVLYTSTGKVQTCLDNNIDIMIDDFHGYIDEVSSAGITCIQLIPGELKEVQKENVHICRNWGEIFKTVQELSNN